MPLYRIREVADLLGVSDDTARRWADAGALPSTLDAGGRTVVDGAALAAFAVEHAAAAASDPAAVRRSARNRFTGLVTRVVADGVMAQVEMQCGPHRVVSLMSREAAEELHLEPGSRATAVVKATTVVVETAAGRS
ncbi:TOBE domain-containing protein [Kineococcus sp. SYSU DK006]|uniref:TOBE domain-containing protein n=1 Tax=Kineococcus sp. SYSU DK006 TaxID=3383127 RepID=UPI003D7C50E8